MRKVVLFSGGVDSLYTMLKDLYDNPDSVYVLLFIKNDIDDEDETVVKNYYSLLKDLYPENIDSLIIQEIKYKRSDGYCSYTPKIWTWLNLYSTAIQIALDVGASVIMSGASIGDGQEELKYHEMFSKFTEELYGIDIVTPLLDKKIEKDYIVKSVISFISSSDKDKKEIKKRLIELINT